jgi:hypothetical protein
VRPGQYRLTGNRPWTTIVGVDLLNLVTYITTWTDANIDKMVVFIFNNWQDLYSHQAISKCLEELDLTRKRASTKGYQTQQPIIQFCIWSFWNCPFLLGVYQVS